MSEIVRCECCQGKKKMMSLGMMMKNCRECNGVGYIDIKSEPKPRGRRKKEEVSDGEEANTA